MLPIRLLIDEIENYLQSEAPKSSEIVMEVITFDLRLSKYQRIYRNLVSLLF